MKRITVFLMSLLMVFWIGTYANALVLTLDDGVNPTVTVADGDGDGVVIFNGSLGVWGVNVTTGISVPTIGTPTWPQMDLNSVNVSSTGSGTLKISLYNDFPSISSYVSGFDALFGGTTQGTVEYKFYVGATEVTPSNFGTYGPGAFSDTGSFSYPDGSTELEIVALITHDAAGKITSFDVGLEPVPEPGTLLLLGSGLIGLAFLKRRKS